MNGADLVATALKAEGVEILPCFPYNQIIESAAQIGIRPIVVRQERQALHIADGYARATGGRKIAAAAVQEGPGAENAFGGVAQCYGDNVPVLYLPGAYSTDNHWIEPNFVSTTALKPITKHISLVPKTERLPLALRNAFAQLRNGRPGPVALELPDEVLSDDADEKLLELLKDYAPTRRQIVRPDPEAVSDVVEAIKSSKNPVIVAGQGVLYSGASEELVRLAEKLEIPVLSTLNGKSAFPENHPLYLGCGGRTQSDMIVEFLKKADVIFGVGTSFTTSDYITPYPKQGRTYIQITNCEADISKCYPVKLPLISDAREALLAIIDAVDEAGPERQGVRGEVEGLRAQFMEKWAPLLNSDETPITPYRVIHELMGVIDRQRSVVTHDAGSPRDQITPFYESHIPHGYIGWGKTTQLGLGLGLIQGAKLARPDFTCVNFMGDAAIGMVGMDFETGVREKIGTTTIMMNNSLMGGYSDYFPEATAKHNINLLGGNYSELARALGGHGERVSDPAEIATALKRAFAINEEGKPALIEIMTREEKRLALHPDAELFVNS